MGKMTSNKDVPSVLSRAIGAIQGFALQKKSQKCNNETTKTIMTIVNRQGETIIRDFFEANWKEILAILTREKFVVVKVPRKASKASIASKASKASKASIASIAAKALLKAEKAEKQKEILVEINKNKGLALKAKPAATTAKNAYEIVNSEYL